MLLERCKTPSSLKSLDLSKEESLLLPKDTELVLDEKDRISKLKTKDMSETELMLSRKNVALLGLTSLINYSTKTLFCRSIWYKVKIIPKTFKITGGLLNKKALSASNCDKNAAAFKIFCDKEFLKL